MVPYINPANQAPGVQTDPAPWIKSFHRLIMEKLKKKSPVTMRPTAYKLGMKQCLVVPYINPANHAPGVQTSPIPGIKSFHRLMMEKTLNKSAKVALNRSPVLVTSLYNVHQLYKCLCNPREAHF